MGQMVHNNGIIPCAIFSVPKLQDETNETR